MQNHVSQKVAQRPAVVLLTVSSWDEPKRLRKQVAEVLSKDNEVIYVVLPYGFCRPQSNVDTHKDGLRVINIAGPIIPLRLIFRIPVLRRFYVWLLSRRLKLRLRDIDNVSAVACFTHDYPEILKIFKCASVVYVANDDHSAIATSSLARATIEKNEASTIALCNSVMSVSQQISVKLARYGKPVYLFYPGHDSKCLSIDSFRLTKRLEKSTCFFGYIDWRVDFHLLRVLMLNGWSVSLIGPVIGREADVNELINIFPQLFSLDNAMEPACAAERLAQHEVLIMPYRFRTVEQAEAVELPNKTFIYLSALRPIVATWMPNLKMVEPGLIYRAVNDEAFVECCMRAVKEDSSFQAVRRGILAESHTWNVRRELLNSIIHNTGSFSGSGGTAPYR